MKHENEHAFGQRLTVARYRLDNGLGVVLLPDHSAPVLSYQTWFHVGSRHERHGKTGLAHLLEHLMFNQTAHLAPGEFDRRIEAAGGDSNAATWVDWTYYRDNLPAARLELIVELEADRMRNLTLTDEQVASEREVVANERRFRVEDDVEGLLGEELFRLAYTVHPYGWPTIGWMEDIRGLTPDDARHFYRTYYAPNNATLVLAGDIDPEAALALVERHYGPMAPAEIPVERMPVEPPQEAERRAARPQPVAAERALYAYRSPAQDDHDWLAMRFLTELLIGGPSSRLHRRLVVEREVAASVRGMLAPFRDPGLLEIYVAMKRDAPAAVAEQVLDEETAKLGAGDLSPGELEKARNRVETDFWAELETAEGKAEALGHHEIVLGDYRRLFEVPERIRAIDLDDLRHVAVTYLQRQARTVVLATPQGGPGDEEVEP